ncbi:MAG TPA: hypothetical protein VFT01_01910 [Homoserinimonas sp.]|nr:hypothetical protein [Homoserinimonas sp.]
MALSRKRERELKKLRNSASELWEDQREVLEHASNVVREAGKQVGYLGREQVVPKVRGTIDQRIKPTVASGVAVTRHVAGSARDKVAHDVFPSVASAIASALAVIEVAKDAKVKEVTRQLAKAGDKASKAGRKAAGRVGLAKPAPRRGPGRYILMGLGVVAAAGVAYAAWQTLREDDDLWISDELEESPAKLEAL